MQEARWTEKPRVTQGISGILPAATRYLLACCSRNFSWAGLDTGIRDTRFIMAAEPDTLSDGDILGLLCTQVDASLT